MSDSERNKRIVLAFVDAVNAQDWDALDRLVVPEFVRHSDAAGEPGVRSRDDLKWFLRNEYLTFPDARETVEDLVAEGDRVAARHLLAGTQTGPFGDHAPTGRPVRVRYLAVYRLEAGRLVEAWAEWDNLAAFAQMGLAPGGARAEPSLHELLDDAYGPDGDAELARRLEAGADLTARAGAAAETPLHVAARRRRAGAVRRLLDHGADIDARTAGGKTAYAHAARRGFSELASLLAERGADTTLAPADRLAVAVVGGELDEARRLLEAHPGCARTGNPEEDRLLADVAGRNGTAPWPCSSPRARISRRRGSTRGPRCIRPRGSASPTTPACCWRPARRSTSSMRATTARRSGGRCTARATPAARGTGPKPTSRSSACCSTRGPACTIRTGRTTART